MMKTLFKIIIILVLIVVAVKVTAPEERQAFLPELKDAEMTIARKIFIEAKANGVDVDKALNIAQCESCMGTQLFNKEGSSAKGVFMFIDSTWEHYCEGDVLNEDDNIKCFIKLYQQHPGWWKCKG